MPKIVPLSRIGLTFQNLFGELGPEHDVTIHHTAGARDTSVAHAISMVRSYHADHKAKGWGGIGYHYAICTNGTILCLRPVRLKGAHVGGWNTGNVGVVFFGTTGNRPSEAQVDSFKWLLSHANTSKMPASHRTDRPLNRPHTERRGHNDWSGHEWNACPGTFRPILKFRRR